MNQRIWMVRAGRGGYLIDEFFEDGIIAIGWNEMGPLSADISYDALKAKFRDVYPDDADGRVNQCVGQIWKFLKEFKIGDKVVSYDSAGREYYTGEIRSDYHFSNEYEYHHYRQVKWNQEATVRDFLSSEARNTLGASSTIFELSQEIWGELMGNHVPEITEEEPAEFEKTQAEQNLRFLKDDIASRAMAEQLNGSEYDNTIKFLRKANYHIKEFKIDASNEDSI